MTGSNVIVRSKDLSPGSSYKLLVLVLVLLSLVPFFGGKGNFGSPHLGEMETPVKA